MADKYEHPFEPVPGTDAEMFIQWKDTNVCMDFYCPCGAQGHIDEWFCYNLKCPSCGTFYEMGTQVKAVKLNGEPDGVYREFQVND